MNTVDNSTATETIKKTFPVTGMTCASCANSVDKTLNAQKGIIKASVNLASSTALVEYKPDVANISNVKKAIQSIGYDLIIDEPVNSAASFNDANKKEYKTLFLRTVLSVTFSLPLLFIGMFAITMPYANYVMWALATPVVIVFGRQFFIGAWKQAMHHSANMDTLVALSTGIAYLFSVFNTLYPQFWIRRGLHAHVYFEAAAIVITFILLGKMLEGRAKANTSSAIKKLMGLQPKAVNVVYEDGRIIEIPVAEVKPGNIVQVKPGNSIPVDGIVTEGSSYVDESMMSGEAIPVLKEKGSRVLAGTINQKGSFLFKANKVGADTVLANIIRMVQEAQGSKAPVQKLVDKIAGVFVPVVMVAALIAFSTWWALGGNNGFTHGLLAMVTVLVIACPCALGLATPTAVMVGIGKGAENGILIKDAESLELAQKVNTLVLDKTGTITEGHPEVVGIKWKEGLDNKQLASILYSIEQQSEHPLAEAIVRYLQTDNESFPVGMFESVTGQGIAATCDGKIYFAGNNKLLESFNISVVPALLQQATEWLKGANTVIWFADSSTTLAVIAIADKIKEGAVQAIKSMQGIGIDVCMLTGDNAQTARAIADQAGITQYQAEMMPADKAAFVKSLQTQGKIVAMVGDGINDSQALAQADVSIAMAKGTDIAIDVAGITLISSDLRHIPMAINLSRKTVRLIRQNLFWAFIYNIIGIPIAAGILYPVNHFLLNPMIAGAAMALSSVSVVSNSLRLKWSKL